MKKIFIVFVILLSSFVNIFSAIEIIKPIKNGKTSFAIIVDKETYSKTHDAVIAYRDAVESEGLATYILIAENENPDEIKSVIYSLYNKKPALEGVVFVGDIPIPMIRDAQHMTSAFKLDQERDWFDSSVPSDRFYEDFDLKFKFLKKDSVHTSCYYYSLLGSSPQKVTKDIYSGRIKPPVSDESKYKLITDYLNKVVKAKKEAEVLDNAFVFTGHGYHSESETNWNDEYLTLKEQFPNLYLPGNNFKFLRYSMSRNMKGILMHELSNKKLDFALFHAHGDVEEQYLLDDPANENINDNISWIQRFLRSKVRTAKARKQNVDEAIKYYQKEYDIHDSWFKDIFKDSLIKADSIYDYSLNIHSNDLSRFQPEAKFVIFDECFNGSYHVENYISGKYVFSNGNTIAAFANSVNVLQDLWTDELLGLLKNGVRIGQLHKIRSGYLENHIIGDPTFHFKNITNLDVASFIDNTDVKFWKNLSTNADPEIKSLAIIKLYQLLGKKYESELVNYYKTESSFNVRLMAFYCLASLNSDAFKNILPLAANDPLGFIRIKATMFMGDVCDNNFIPILIDKMINDECPRVSFSAKGSLQFFNQDSVMNQLDKKIKSLPDYFMTKNTSDMLINTCKRNKEWLRDEIIKVIWDSNAKVTKRKNQIRTFRNYPFDEGIPELIKFANSKDQPENLRINSIEALGWNYFKYQKYDLIKIMDDFINSSESNEIKNEAERTKNRLLYGPNVPLTP